MVDGGVPDPAPPLPVSAARARASKTDILRVSRGRVREPPPAQPAENKRKRASSRENSLESLLETEEDPAPEDSASRESLGTRPWRQPRVTES